MSDYSNPIQNLEKLVGFKSVSHLPNLDLCDFIAHACSSLGFVCELEKDLSNDKKANVIATIGPKEKGGLIVSGHLDVVPTQGQPWTSDPFKLTLREGRLYGRGTSDMKGFIASTLAALSQMDLAIIKKPIVLVWTYDEEIGCKGSAEFVRRRHETLPDWYPTEALIGEPTDLQVFRMHPGHVGVKVVITGRAAHSSKPDLGASAIKTAGRVLNVLESLEKDLAKERRLELYLERPFVVLNVGMIKGGEAINIVPDRCEIDIGYRPLPGDDPRIVFERISELVAKETRDLSTSTELHLQNITPALLTDDKTPLMKLIQPHSHSKVAGAASFATDGGNLASLGIRSLIFGPGSIDVAHRADEFIDADALNMAPSVIANILRSRCE